MFGKITPEQAGIKSEFVTKFIKSLERKGIVAHSVLMIRGNDIFAEYYWNPFNKDTCHRMYSQTKSFVSVAIGLLQEDGKLSIDEPMSKYFPEKIDRELPPYLRNMTIKQMLTMETCGRSPFWFTHSEPDRTRLYFNENTAVIPAGMRWEYDSPGSQVLSALVEKLSGKSLFDFLSERIFKHLGTFKTATILKTKTEDSFGDSALYCTPRDIASFGRFVMNYGTHNGKRLMNEAYLKEATSRVVENYNIGFNAAFTQGYGYQIWRTEFGGFAFYGMGCQLTICIPKKDFIFVCTGDNQGYAEYPGLVMHSLYDLILDNLEDSPLPENEAAYKESLAIGETLELYHLENQCSTDFAKELNGKTYVCEENPTGITEFTFSFNGDEGVLNYTNAQGKKVLPFGLGKNVIAKFPQLGYSDCHAGRPSDDPNFMYDCATSVAFCEEKKLLLKVHIIDKFLGNMFATFSFKEDYATVTMLKNAEAFLDEYQGEFVAHLKK